MSFATTDFLFACAHHLCVFALFGVIAGEALLVRQGMSAADVKRVAAVDIWYGVLAGLIVVVGVARITFAAKGWSYYLGNPFFHAKMGTFLAVGLLSIWPTIQFIKWRRVLKADPADLPPADKVAAVRRLLLIEVGLFALLPIFAAAMARGFGS